MSKIASLFVAIPFIAYVALHFGPKGILLGFCYIAFPLVCIWYPDAMGSLTGISLGNLGGPKITKESPGCLVSLAGWGMLVAVVGLKVYQLQAG